MNAGEETPETAADEIETGDRLPWLETADDDYEDKPSILNKLLPMAAGLAVIVAAVGGGWWLLQRTGGGGEGSGALINAADGDYKVKPDDPGGMKVDGAGDTVFAASEGATTNGSINVGAVPEAPVAGKAAPKATPTPVSGASRVTASVPSAPAAKAAAGAQRAAGPSAGSSIIQLGSFPAEAGANAAWARLSKRFNYLAPLGKSVEKADVNGRTVYRLRVNTGSNSQASELCGKLKAAGEACFLAPN